MKVLSVYGRLLKGLVKVNGTALFTLLKDRLAYKQRQDVSYRLGHAQVLECRRFKDEELALGRAVNLLRGLEPFRSYDFGKLSNVLMGQIKRGHYLFTLEEGKLVGYMGWALCRDEIAKAWVENRYVPSFQECNEGDCWVGITFFAATSKVCRFQARACRQLYPGYAVYGIRDYGRRRRSTQTVNRVFESAA